MQVVLIMFRPDGSRRSFSLARDLTVIGRGEECDLRIPLGEVSRKHANMVKDGETLRVEDLGSSNGTFVNGQRIQETALIGGDILHIGPLSFVVQLDGVPADDEIVPPEQQIAASSDDTGTAPMDAAPATEEAVQTDDNSVVELEAAALEEAVALEGNTLPRHSSIPKPPPLPPGVKQFEPAPVERPEEYSLDVVDDTAPQQPADPNDIQIIDDTK